LTQEILQVLANPIQSIPLMQIFSSISPNLPFRSYKAFYTIVVFVTSLSGNAYMGRQVLWRNEQWENVDM